MRPKTLAALFLATLCLALSLPLAQGAPVEPIQAKIEFDDYYPSAALKSDGGGPYVSLYAHNQPVANARIIANTGLLSLSFDSSATRYLKMNLSSTVSDFPCTVFPPSPNYPPIPDALSPTGGWFPTQARLDVVGIYLVPVGSTVRTGAVVRFGPYGDVRLGAWDEPTNFCSGQVWVTRWDATHWEIWSPVQPNSAPSGADGIAVVVQNFSTKPNGSDPHAVRYVNLPFRIWVTALP